MIEYSPVFRPVDEHKWWISLNMALYYTRRPQWKILDSGGELNSSRNCNLNYIKSSETKIYNTTAVNGTYIQLQ